MLGLAAILIVALTVIDDKTIETYGGDVGTTIMQTKRSSLDAVGGLLNAVGGSVLDAFGGGASGQDIPRVVQDIPPPPTPATVAQPVQTQTLAEVATETQQLYQERRSVNIATSMAAETSTATSPTTMTPEETQARPVEQAPLIPEQAPPAPAPKTNTDVAPMSPAGDAPPSPPEMAAMPEAKSQPAPDTMASLTASDPTTVSEQPQSAERPSEEDASPVSGIETLLEEAAQTELEPVSPDGPDPNGDEAYAEAIRYYTGDGVERNFGTAAQYFIKAAERGHAGAQYNLGLMNYVGQTGGQDFANAAKWFEQAAESGHIQAQYNLGFLYYEGKGVQQDLKTAYDWIDRAAQQGYAKAIKARDALKKAMPEIFGS